jgi:ABC-2 type transport system ATP-binding protein
MPLLDVSDVAKRFGQQAALSGATFHVETGELFGLLGPNGAGKTTLMSVIAGLITPDSGEVRLDGRPLRPNDAELKRAVGVVPQELAVYDNLTARENIIFFGELFGMGGHELKEHAAVLLSKVGLDGRADSFVGTFSGGMKRRLNLAVSLVHRPRLLLLDEPTVGVDPQSRNLIFEEVRRLNREGMTVVYTSHYMEEVEALCSRVGIIDRGRVVACDALEHLLQKLRGLIRIEVRGGAAQLERLLAALPDVAVNRDGGRLSVETGDVKATLVRVIGVLNEANARLVQLTTEEPNLERVFLHLTGRGLRD